jgi:DNA-directed RNA polymerase specialized sigma24 family protein
MVKQGADETDAESADQPLEQNRPRWLDELAWMLVREPGADLLTLLSLRQALESLPPRQRRLIYLRYFEGLPLSEIARRDGLAPESVREALTRALVRIRQLMTLPGPTTH